MATCVYIYMTALSSNLMSRTNILLHGAWSFTWAAGESSQKKNKKKQKTKKKKKENQPKKTRHIVDDYNTGRSFNVACGIAFSPINVQDRVSRIATILSTHAKDAKLNKVSIRFNLHLVLHKHDSKLIRKHQKSSSKKPLLIEVAAES